MRSPPLSCRTSEDWTRFGPNEIRDADFVIVALSQAWMRRFDGTEDPTVGAGAAREADALLSIFHRDRDAFVRKTKLVILPGADRGARERRRAYLV